MSDYVEQWGSPGRIEGEYGVGGGGGGRVDLLSKPGRVGSRRRLVREDVPGMVVQDVMGGWWCMQLLALRLSEVSVKLVLPSRA